MLEGQSETPAGPSPDQSGIFNNKTRLAVVGLTLFLAVGYLVYAAFPGSTMYYVTVSEFLSDGQNLDGRNVRVVGKLVPESFERTPDTIQANFMLSDEGEMMRATYHGVVPDLFFSPHSDIVLEGSYGGDGVFQVRDVVVKCPSKYEALREQA